MLQSAYDVLTVTPSDTDPLPQEAFALRADTDGTITVVTRAGEIRTLSFITGETRMVFTQKVMETDTTVTGIEAMVNERINLPTAEQD